MAPRILAWHRDSGRYEKVFSRKDAESAEDAEGERGQGQYLAENAEDAEERNRKFSLRAWRSLRDICVSAAVFWISPYFTVASNPG